MEGFRAAHAKIREEAANTPGLESMGTTCVAAAVTGSTLHFANIGDSRLYFVRGHEIRQLSEELLPEGSKTHRVWAQHGVIVLAVDDGLRLDLAVRWLVSGVFFDHLPDDQSVLFGSIHRTILSHAVSKPVTRRVSWNTPWRKWKGIAAASGMRPRA